MSTKVRVAKLPDCDIHKMAGVIHPAKYDAKTPHGPWANMCSDAFESLHCSLGTGHGQELILEEKKHD